MFKKSSSISRNPSGELRGDGRSSPDNVQQQVTSRTVQSHTVSPRSSSRTGSPRRFTLFNKSSDARSPINSPRSVQVDTPIIPPRKSSSESPRKMSIKISSTDKAEAASSSILKDNTIKRIIEEYQRGVSKIVRSLSASEICNYLQRLIVSIVPSRSSMFIVRLCLDDKLDRSLEDEIADPSPIVQKIIGAADYTYDNIEHAYHEAASMIKSLRTLADMILRPREYEINEWFNCDYTFSMLAISALVEEVLDRNYKSKSNILDESHIAAVVHSIQKIESVLRDLEKSKIECCECNLFKFNQLRKMIEIGANYRDIIQCSCNMVMQELQKCL